MKENIGLLMNVDPEKTFLAVSKNIVLRVLT